MFIDVTKNNVLVNEDSFETHQGEYNVTTCYFTFSEEFNSLIKIACFTINSSDETYKVDIIDNECNIPAEVLSKEFETVTLGVYGYVADQNDNLELRYSPTPFEFYVERGSYKEGGETPEIITPTQYELYSQQLQEGLDRVDDKIVEIDEAIERTENIDVDAEKIGKITSITITRQDGTTKTVTLEDGMGLNYMWVDTKLGVKREDEQEYVYVDLQGPKGEPGSIKFIIVETLPSENIDESAIYLTPSENPDLKNHYDEWIWVTDRFEPLGETQIEVDLTDYVKNTDYASASKGGVVKSGSNGFNVNSSTGAVSCSPRNYATQYVNDSDYYFISKGTLENVITGKGLVSNTDYASASVGGVIKTPSTLGIGVGDTGNVFAQTSTYAEYGNRPPGYFIGKATLDNVITGKGLVSNTDYASSNGGVIKVSAGQGTATNSSGYLIGQTRTYTQYQSDANTLFVCKGTLDNVLTAKIGDIQTLLDNLNTGNGV